MRKSLKKNWKRIVAFGLMGAVLLGATTGCVDTEELTTNAVADFKASNDGLKWQASDNLTPEDVEAIKAGVDITTDNKGAVDAWLLEKGVTEAEVDDMDLLKADSNNLKLVLNHIFDNEGNVAYLTEDLDDEEIMQIADRVVFINDIKSLAVKAVKDDGIDELDDEMVGETELDDDDIRRFKVDSDFEDIIVRGVDFDYKDAEVEVEVSFKQDDVEYGARFIVYFEDGEVDEVEVDEIWEED